MKTGISAPTRIESYPSLVRSNDTMTKNKAGSSPRDDRSRISLILSTEAWNKNPIYWLG